MKTLSPQQRRERFDFNKEIKKSRELVDRIYKEFCRNGRSFPSWSDG